MYGQVPVAQPVQMQQQQQFYGAQQPALQQWFQAVDTDRSGRISTQELQKALQMGGLNFSLKLVASLVRMHDADKTNTLSFAEFCEMQTYLTRLQQTFSQCAGGGQQLQLQQTQSALSTLGYNLDMQPDGAFYKIVQSYDFTMNGSVGLDSFIAMNIQLKNAQKMFNLFDAQRTGRVTMDFNQYVWTLAQL